MTTRILFNGSKWAGEEPDTLEQLEARLSTEPLDPKWEHYGDFVELPGDDFSDHHGVPGGTLFSGNFLNLSATFSVLTNDADVIARLSMLVAANKTRADYVEARPAVIAACNCEVCRPDPNRVSRPLKRRSRTSEERNIP